MKYTLVIVIAFLVTSCGPAYIANKKEKNLKGKWVLESISYPNSSGLFNVEILDVAEVSCFENSIWNFIPNNSSGKFTLDGNDCLKTQQEFTWYIDSQTARSINPEMLLKVTTGRKPKNVERGTRIKIKSLLANSMVWEQTAMFKGKQIQIEMKFSKL